jgi:nucleoside-diphosphate-sugar epimerase
MMSAYKRSFTKDNKILVLGGSGFLGTHLSKELKDNGYTNVIVGARNVPASEGSVALDICEESSIDIIKNFDIIYNLTGQVTKPMQDCLKQNSTGCVNIARAVNASNAFLVQVSTVGVYGSVKMADDNSALLPETTYSTCKAIAETIFETSLSPDRYSVIRISNLYGNNQAKGVFAYLLRMSIANSGENLYFDNDGSLVRYYLNVEDCAAGLVKLIGLDTDQVKGKFNFVGTEKYTIVELISLFENATGLSFNTDFEPDRPRDNALEIKSDRFNTLVQPAYTKDLSSFIKEFIREK